LASEDDTERDYVRQDVQAEEPTLNECERRPKRKAAVRSDAIRRDIKTLLIFSIHVFVDESRYHFFEHSRISLGV
jgi:hypothetical protein